MSYRIFTKGNYFYIVDNDTEREFNALSKDLTVYRGKTNTDNFNFGLIQNWSQGKVLDIAEIQNENGDAYTTEGFVSFYETATGLASTSNDYNSDVSLGKVDGGGGDPVVNLRMFSFSRVTLGRYDVYDIDIDAQRDNNLDIQLPQSIVFGGREVIYITGESDKSNTKVFIRFSGNQTNA